MTGRKCAFCGKEGTLTKEHVFPDWLATLFREQLGKKPNARHVVSGSDENREWASGPFTLTARVVCADCNNGWMAQLEGVAKPLLTELAFTRTQHDLSQEEQGMLAFWAQKTLLMLSKANSSGLQIPQEHFDVVYREKSPDPRLNVQIGQRSLEDAPSEISYAGYELHQIEQAQVPRELAEAVEKSRSILWTGTIHLGQLVFKIVGQNIGTVEIGGTDPKVLPQIYPSSEASVSWPPEQSIDDIGGLSRVQSL